MALAVFVTPEGAGSRARVRPLLLLPERVALDVQVQDEVKGSLIRHLRAGVLTHAAGCREVNGADMALTWRGSARRVDEGAIRLDPGQEARGHEIADLGAEHPVRLHSD